MHWYLNDISLQGQFSENPDKFWETLIELQETHDRDSFFNGKFSIAQNFSTREVVPNVDVINFLLNEKNPKFRDKKFIVINFIKERMMYYDENNNINETIEFQGNDVKETAISIATKEKLQDRECSLFSFKKGEIEFEYSPLIVKYFSGTGSTNDISLKNFFELDALKQNIHDHKPKNSWDDLIKIINEEFVHIEFRADLFDGIIKYNKNIFDIEYYEHLYELFKILNNYMLNRIGGTENSEAKRIRKTYFPGSGATGKKFSDESTKRKKNLAKRFRFPSISGEMKVATWHGKFKTKNKKFIRVYFEWNVDKNKSKIEIYYIGPKILK